MVKLLIVVTRWPKHKILNFKKRWWNYGHQVTKTQNLEFKKKDFWNYIHQVTKTQNFEFYQKMVKLLSPGDQSTKFKILKKDSEIIITRWKKNTKLRI